MGMCNKHVSLVLAVMILTSGCERPFVEPEVPEIEILEPDFTDIFAASRIDVVVRARAARSVEEVLVNDDTLTFDPDEGVWTGDIGLRTGLNRLVFFAASESRTVTDTVHAFRASLFVHRTGTHLPDARGGHTATLLSSGSVLVTGGAPDEGALASDAAFVLPGGSGSFRTLTARLNEARAGHTATLLPDGRVLIVGGSRSDRPDDVADLVNTVEIFDPETETFQIVPFSGEPIRRALHSASVNPSGASPTIDLYGGRGDIRYRPQSQFGTRSDIQTFIFRRDSLIAVSPAPGPLLDLAMSGHQTTPLEERNSQRFLVTGLNVAELNVAFILDFAAPEGIGQDTTGRMAVERTRHAAENLQTGFIGVFGGRSDDAAALSDVELYVHAAGRFFRFPPSEFVLRRFGLTATKLPNDRILLLGGFSPSGEGLTASEIFLPPPM